MAKNTADEPRIFDFNADRFPPVTKALAKIAAEADLVEGQPEHLEIHFLACGEATWRMWIKGLDEPEGGVLDLS